MPDNTPPVQRPIERKPAYFESPAIDNLFTITMELGAALWVVKERLRTLETVLEEAGISVRERVESYEPSAEERQRIIAERDQFVDQIYRSIRENPG